LLLSCFVTLIPIVVIDELGCISTKFRLELVVGEVLIKAILLKVTCFSRVVGSLSKEAPEFVVKDIESTSKVEVVIMYFILRKGDLFRV